MKGQTPLAVTNRKQEGTFQPEAPALFQRKMNTGVQKMPAALWKMLKFQEERMGETF